MTKDIILEHDLYKNWGCIIVWCNEGFETSKKSEDKGIYLLGDIVKITFWKKRQKKYDKLNSNLLVFYSFNLRNKLIFEYSLISFNDY